MHVTREKITWPGARIKKKGEGMPLYENNQAHGDLYITFDVQFPRGNLTNDERQGRGPPFLTFKELTESRHLKYMYVAHLVQNTVLSTFI